jgi:hypothetical protein
MRYNRTFKLVIQCRPPGCCYITLQNHVNCVYDHLNQSSPDPHDQSGQRDLFDQIQNHDGKGMIICLQIAKIIHLREVGDH